MRPQPVPRQPSHDQIVAAARALRDGGIEAFPTARALAAHWPEAARKLAAAFWPGPLTIIVQKADRVPACVTAGLDTVGLRVPAHPVARALLRAAGVPVAAPSANPFTRLSATRAEHVRAAFPTGIDVILDGGRSPVGIESTVVTLVAAEPRLLRHGAISLAQLRSVVGAIAPPPCVVTGDAHPSPGMHARHYSPRTRLVVLAPDAPSPPGRGVRVHRETDTTAATGTDHADAVVLPADAGGFASRLYETLHELDGRDLDWIAVDAPPGSPEWDAVRDRLQRAAT